MSQGVTGYLIIDTASSCDKHAVWARAVVNQFAVRGKQLVNVCAASELTLDSHGLVRSSNDDIELMKHSRERWLMQCVPRREDPILALSLQLLVQLFDDIVLEFLTRCSLARR